MVGDFNGGNDGQVLWTGSQVDGYFTLSESIKKYKLAIVTTKSFESAVGAVTDAGIRLLFSGGSDSGYYIQFTNFSISADGKTLTAQQNKYMEHRPSDSHGRIATGFPITKIEGICRR